jgi:hypothetical protein
MSLTLIEASKLSIDVLQRGVVEVFARTSPVLELLPFMEIAGNSYKYNQEQTMPGIAFRGVNEAYVESAGVVNQLSEGLTILGGDVDVDKFLAQTRGNVNDLRAIQTEMKSKALAMEWTQTFFKGDATATPNSFDGLQKRLTGSQVIHADGAGTAGATLTLEKLDELIDAVVGEPDVLFMSKAMRREVKKLLVSNNHYIENGSDAFGRPVATYAGIPLRVLDENAGYDILGFTETVGADTACASIYAVKFGAEQYCSGLRNGSVSVRDLGEVQDKPVYRTRIEFYSGFAVFHPRACARLAGIKKSS